MTLANRRIFNLLILIILCMAQSSTKKIHTRGPVSVSAFVAVRPKVVINQESTRTFILLVELRWNEDDCLPNNKKPRSYSRGSYGPCKIGFVDSNTRSQTSHTFSKMKSKPDALKACKVIIDGFLSGYMCWECAVVVKFNGMSAGMSEYHEK